MTVVELTSFEMFTAAQAGCMRQIEALKLGRREDLDGDPKEVDAWSRHTLGAIAECAVAKMLDVYWEPVVRRPTELMSDVGTERDQVRSTHHPGGCLILHKRNPDAARYWLVLTHDLPRAKVVGWISGSDGKQEQWWRTNVPRAAYFVPQSELIT